MDAHTEESGFQTSQKFRMPLLDEEGVLKLGSDLVECASVPELVDCAVRCFLKRQNEQIRRRIAFFLGDRVFSDNEFWVLFSSFTSVESSESHSFNLLMFCVTIADICERCRRGFSDFGPLAVDTVSVLTSLRALVTRFFVSVGYSKGRGLKSTNLQRAETLLNYNAVLRYYEACVTVVVSRSVYNYFGLRLFDGLTNDEFGGAFGELITHPSLGKKYTRTWLNPLRRFVRELRTVDVQIYLEGTLFSYGQGAPREEGAGRTETSSSDVEFSDDQTSEETTAIDVDDDSEDSTATTRNNLISEYGIHGDFRSPYKNALELYTSQQALKSPQAEGSEYEHKSVAPEVPIFVCTEAGRDLTHMLCVLGIHFPYFLYCRDADGKTAVGEAQESRKHDALYIMLKYINENKVTHLAHPLMQCFKTERTLFGSSSKRSSVLNAFLQSHCQLSSLAFELIVDALVDASDVLMVDPSIEDDDDGHALQIALTQPGVALRSVWFLIRKLRSVNKLSFNSSQTNAHGSSHTLLMHFLDRFNEVNGNMTAEGNGQELYRMKIAYCLVHEGGIDVNAIDNHPQKGLGATALTIACGNLNLSNSFIIFLMTKLGANPNIPRCGGHAHPSIPNRLRKLLAGKDQYPFEIYCQRLDVSLPPTASPISSSNSVQIQIEAIIAVIDAFIIAGFDFNANPFFEIKGTGVAEETRKRKLRRAEVSKGDSGDVDQEITDSASFSNLGLSQGHTEGEILRLVCRTLPIECILHLLSEDRRHVFSSQALSLSDGHSHPLVPFLQFPPHPRGDFRVDRITVRRSAVVEAFDRCGMISAADREKLLSTAIQYSNPSLVSYLLSNGYTAPISLICLSLAERKGHAHGVQTLLKLLLSAGFDPCEMRESPKLKAGGVGLRTKDVLRRLLDEMGDDC